MSRVCVAGMLVMVLLGLAAPGQAAEHPPASPIAPRFVPGRCEWQTPEGATDGIDLTCGYLWVPMRHSAQSSREIGLAVMILHATGPNPAPDPIIWNTGGPGGSTIDDYGTFLVTSPLRKDRDMVLVDQRGSGYSLPYLYCPDLAQAEEGTGPDPAHYRRIGEALIACSRELSAQRIELSAFNPSESAMDIEDLRVALGYPKVNLYGVSYGSLVALETLRRSSSTIRAVVLDGIVPPGIDPMVVDDVAALDKVFAACDARPQCRSMYPNLPQEYLDVIDRLDALPAILEKADPANGLLEDTVLTGDLFRSALHTLMYMEGLVPYLPLIVHAASQGDFFLLVNAFSLLDYPQIDTAAYWAAYCQGIAALAASHTDQALACAELLLEKGQAPLGTSPEGSPRTPESQPGQVTSDVPVLLLNGEYDPITPPSYGYLVAKTLSKSTVVVLPGGGHAAFGNNECADGLMGQFYNAPDTSLDLSCVEDSPALEFKGPLAAGDLFPAENPPLGYNVKYFLYGLRLGGYQHLHNVVLGSIGVLWLVLVVLGVLTLLLGPAKWLTLLRRGRPAKRPPVLARLMPVWSLGFIAVVTVLLGYLVLVIWGDLMTSDLASLQPWVLPLPLFVGIFCLLNMAGTYRGLRSGAWPIWLRVLHMAITVPACSLTLGLILLGAAAGWT